MVGYLLEELRDASNLATFKRDVADANIFIGSLIFIEELADKAGPLPPLPCLPSLAPHLQAWHVWQTGAPAQGAGHRLSHPRLPLSCMISVPLGPCTTLHSW